MSSSPASDNVDWLKQWARLSPSNIAFKDGDTSATFTYFELFHVVDAVSRELSKKFSLKQGDRVAMLATNEIEAVVLFFSCLRLGCVFVPINFRLTAAEIAHILSDCEASLLLSQSSFQKVVDTVFLNPSHSLPHNVFNFADFQELVAKQLEMVRSSSFKPRRHAHANDDNENPHVADQPCMILYTSGTTGAPKGAMITPKMLHWNSLNTTLRLNISQNDVFVSFLPFFHTAGWNVLLTPFVHRGAKIVLTKKFDADRILSLCESEEATIMFGVPTTLEMMSRSSIFPKVDLSRVRYAIVGGEPMSIELIHTWQKKGIAIRQGFGLTEFGPSVFSLNEEDALRKIGSIGFPNFYVQARVVDDERYDVAPGETGELLLRGPVCTPGYWRNEKATQETIVDGWLHTGDLVRVDDEGYFYVAGRKKDMFISGGENVYPVEVEQVMSEHSAIREVAVIGIPDEKWGEVGRAYVSLAEGSSVNADELLAFCNDKLAKYKIPKEVCFLEDLPKGDSGKILKRRLREIS
jgi:fatty-acyl-CoA synthase